MKTFTRGRLIALLGISALTVAGCSNQRIMQYQTQKPELDLVKFFVGTTDAWGMFQDRSGQVQKRFKVTIEGKMNGQQLILNESFVYSDQTTQNRFWTLTPQAQGRWTGTAADVEGEAQGQVAGNALNWKYTLKLPVDNKVYQVQFDDWMYLLDEQTMMNRASMSKFGVELGQVTLTFRKR